MVILKLVRPQMALLKSVSVFTFSSQGRPFKLTLKVYAT